jgi:sugar lactone lactonase YvrE
VADGAAALIQARSVALAVLAVEGLEVLAGTVLSNLTVKAAAAEHRARAAMADFAEALQAAATPMAATVNLVKAVQAASHRTAPSGVAAEAEAVTTAVVAAAPGAIFILKLSALAAAVVAVRRTWKKALRMSAISGARLPSETGLSSLNGSKSALRSALIIFAAMLAACGGSQLTIGVPGEVPQSRGIITLNEHRELALQAGAPTHGYKPAPPLLFAANLGDSTVTVYRGSAKDPAPLATISDDLTIPLGACIDGQGTLYVADDTDSAGWISEYPLGKTKPSGIIRDGIAGPSYCAIDAKGNLWVTNYGIRNVTEYLAGSKKPHEVITKGLDYPVGIAIDHSGNLYVGNFTTTSENSPGNVVVYAPGSESPSRTITNGVASPRGLAVDSKGTLYVTNLYQNDVVEYRSGQSDPFQTITEAMDRPAGVTVDTKGLLYVSNIANNTVVEFAPGSLKPLKRQISKGVEEPNGIAYYPPLLP